VAGKIRTTSDEIRILVDALSTAVISPAANPGGPEGAWVRVDTGGAGAPDACGVPVIVPREVE